MKSISKCMNRFGDGPAPFTARSGATARGLLLAALMCGLPPLHAELVFHKVDTETPGITDVARITGSALTGLYATGGSADVYQFNAANRSWDVFSSYATHRDNSSLSGNASQIAVSGNHMYVSRLTNPETISIFNGTSWSTLTLSHPFSGVRTVDGIYAQGNQAIITRSAGYINIVSNGVDTITSNHPRPIVNAVFYPINGIVGVGDTVFVKSTSNSFSRSTDFGATWSASAAISTASSSSGSLYALDANTVYSAGYNNAIMRSTNGGTSWSSVALPAGHGGTTRTIYAADANTLYVGGGTGLWFSQDAGVTWSDLSGQLDGYTGQSIRNIYAVEDHIFFSATNGDMWVAIPEPGTLMLMGLGFGTLLLTKAFRK
jgi:hypothetical protein